MKASVQTVWVVTYQFKISGKWKSVTDIFAGQADAEHSAECMGDCKWYRNIEVTANVVFSAGIHAEGIAKRAARNAAAAATV